jgi:hypothetical protein
MILIIGLVIRIILMPLLTYGYDFTHWALSIQHIQAGHGLYAIDGFWYTPVWGYVLGGMSVFLNTIGMVDYGQLFDAALPIENLEWFAYTATLTTLSFNFVVKIPLVITDVIIGYLIYRMIKERTGDEKKATYGFALWFLCPLVIYTSAVHGMFDNISVLFMVLSVYALYKGHDFFAGASLAVAVLTKMFPAYILFVLIAYLAMKHKGDVKTFIKRLSLAAAGLCLMALVIYIPQILDGTITESLRFLTGRVDAATSSSEAAAGVWDSLVSFGFKFVLWVQPLIFLLAAVVAYFMYKKGDGNGDERFFACLMVTTAIIFLWPPAPQYLLITLPFLICFIAMFDKRFILPFIVITTAALFNNLVTHNFSVLMSLAAYTDLMDLGNIVSLVAWMQEPLLLGLSKQYVMMILTASAELIGILMVVLFWIRYNKEGRSYE